MAKKKKDWIGKAAASVKKRGTEGKCGPNCDRPGCTGRALALCKAFHTIAENRKKKAKEGGIAGLTPEKANEILSDGKVHGKPLTDKQRKFFQLAQHGGIAEGDNTLTPDREGNDLVSFEGEEPSTPSDTWFSTNNFRPITKRTAMLGFKDRGMPFSENVDKFYSALDSVYGNQIHQPYKVEEGKYYKNFPTSVEIEDGKKTGARRPFLNSQTGFPVDYKGNNDEDEYGLGGTIGGILGSVASNLPIPGAGLIGSALKGVGTGVDLLTQNKEQNEQQAEQQRLEEERLNKEVQDYQTSNTFSSNYAPSFQQGGMLDKQPVELEKEEVTATPDGNIGKVDLPSHANATDENLELLEPGTKIFSDTPGLRTSGNKTFAEAADEIRKEIKKYEKILNS